MINKIFENYQEEKKVLDTIITTAKLMNYKIYSGVEKDEDENINFIKYNFYTTSIDITLLIAIKNHSLDYVTLSIMLPYKDDNVKKELNRDWRTSHSHKNHLKVLNNALKWLLK